MEPQDVPMSARPEDDEAKRRDDEEQEKKDAAQTSIAPVPVDVNPALSWLKFNQRVLLQATRPDFPVLERCRYVAIWSSNLDEFFQARVTAFYDEAALLPGHQEVLSVAQQDAILSNDIYTQLVRDLQATGIYILSPEQLNITELNYFGAFLAEKVVPRTDLLDPSSLRDVSSGLLYLAAGDRKKIKYFIRVPESLPRLLEVPSRPNAFVRVGQLMRLRKDLFLPEPLPMHEFRIVRLEGGEMARLDWDELPQALEQRAEGVVTRLDVEMSFPKAWEKELQRAFKLDDMEIFHLNPPLDYRFFFRFIESAQRADLMFTPANPRKFPSFTKDPFNFIDQQDLCLYHPLDDFTTVERFVTVASHDPDVDMIRMTGYRLGRKSAMAEALMEAAKRGKDVAVLLEGRARFDELQNLYWRLHFESSGVKILPLVPNYKVHAKVLSIRHQGKTYVQVGTGNYNSANSKLYTDISLITCNPIITKDIEIFFKSMEGGELPNQMSRLLYGKRIRSEMIAKIQAESRPNGHIIIKVNHLTDPEIHAALVSAADAGAKVDLIIRSTLTRLYYKWNQKSIVGRYLEHARMAAFKGKWEVWAGSADWMPRNFDSRVEIFFPILNEQIKNRVLQNILFKQVQDDRNGFQLLPDGRQKSIWSGRVDAQLARL